MPTPPKFTLAIETATQKGSLTLLKDGDEIGFWIGDGINAVSSELLPQISELLETNNITLKDIDLLAVSAGPGSFTGVRIGLAAAKGLQMASGIRSIAIPLPEALARSADGNNEGKHVICLIPSGRGEAYWQEFSGHNPQTEVISSKIEEIAEYLAKNDAYCIAASGLKAEYIEQIESRAGNKVNIAGDNLAKSIGAAAIDKAASESAAEIAPLSPIYVKEFNSGIKKP